MNRYSICLLSDGSGPKLREWNITEQIKDRGGREGLKNMQYKKRETAQERKREVYVFTVSSHICIKLPDTSAAVAAFHYSHAHAPTQSHTYNPKITNQEKEAATAKYKPSFAICFIGPYKCRKKNIYFIYFKNAETVMLFYLFYFLTNK